MVPRLLRSLAGIVLICAGCSVGQTEPVPDVSPSPTISPTTALVPGRSNAPWALQLALTGDLATTVTSTAPGQGGLVNECTGKNSLGNKAWSSTFVLSGPGDVKALVVLVPSYRGAGVYSEGVSIQVHNADLSTVWQNRTGDTVSWTVGTDEESGKISASLSNLADVTRKLAVVGTWTCRT